MKKNNERKIEAHAGGGMCFYNKRKLNIFEKWQLEEDAIQEKFCTAHCERRKK